MYSHVWQKLRTTFQDGTYTETAPTCISGKTIINTATEYSYQSFDNIAKISSDTSLSLEDKIQMFNETPETYLWQSSKLSIPEIMLQEETLNTSLYEWVRTHISWSDGSNTFSTPYCDDTTLTLRAQISTSAQEIISSLEEKGCVRIYENQIYVMNAETELDATEILCLNNKGIGFLQKDTGEAIDPDDFTSVWKLSGNFDAKSIRVENLRADDITNGTLRLYDSEGSTTDGKILIFEGDAPSEIDANNDHNATVAITLDGIEVKLDNGGLFKVSREKGLEVLDAGSALAYGSLTDGSGLKINNAEVTKLSISQQQTFPQGKIEIIPMTVNSGGLTHTGIGFVRQV